MLLGAAALTAAAAEDAAPATPSGGAANAGQAVGSKADSGKTADTEAASAKPGATGPGATGDQPHGGGEHRTGPKGGDAASKGTADSPGRAAAKHSGTNSAPIDAKIAEPNRGTARGVGRPGDTKTGKLVIAPSVRSGSKGAAKPDNKDAVTRNAVGIVVSRQAPAKGPDASAAPATATPAVAAARTAMGPSAAVGASAGQASAGVSGRPSIAPVNNAMNRSMIDGTALRRPNSSPTPMGGPAKNTAIINGSSIRPKH